MLTESLLHTQNEEHWSVFLRGKRIGLVLKETWFEGSRMPWELLLNLAHLRQLKNQGQSLYQERNEKINFSGKPENGSFLGWMYWIKFHSTPWLRLYEVFQITSWDSAVPPKLWFKYLCKIFDVSIKATKFSHLVYLCYFKIPTKKMLFNLFLLLFPFFGSHPLCSSTQDGIKCCLQETDA